MHIGEPEVAAAETEREPLVIEPQQVLHGRPQIINRAAILHRVITEFAGGAMRRAGIAALAQTSAKIQAQTAFLFLCSVTFVALVEPRRPNALLEERELVRGRGGGHPGSEAKNPKGNAHRTAIRVKASAHFRGNDPTRFAVKVFSMFRVFTSVKIWGY